MPSKKEIKSIRRQLLALAVERKFRWSTPEYQTAHIKVLRAEEARLLKKLKEKDGQHHSE